jgi:hypothetical protein
MASLSGNENGARLDGKDCLVSKVSKAECDAGAGKAGVTTISA